MHHVRLKGLLHARRQLHLRQHIAFTLGVRSKLDLRESLVARPVRHLRRIERGVTLDRIDPLVATLTQVFNIHPVTGLNHGRSRFDQCCTALRMHHARRFAIANCLRARTDLEFDLPVIPRG